MTFYSGKGTSFRNDRPEFSFNTQIITCFVFLDKLLHFSEFLFSHLTMGFLKTPKLSLRIVMRMTNTPSTFHVLNTQHIVVTVYSYLCFLLCQFLCWQNGWCLQWWITNCGPEFCNWGRHGLGHRSSYLYSSLENSIACLMVHLQWLSQTAAIIDILTTLKRNQKSEDCLIMLTMKLMGF